MAQDPVDPDRTLLTCSLTHCKVPWSVHTQTRYVHMLYFHSDRDRQCEWGLGPEAIMSIMSIISMLFHLSTHTPYNLEKYLQCGCCCPQFCAYLSSHNLPIFFSYSVPQDFVLSCTMRQSCLSTQSYSTNSHACWRLSSYGVRASAEIHDTSNEQRHRQIRISTSSEKWQDCVLILIATGWMSQLSYIYIQGQGTEYGALRSVECRWDASSLSCMISSIIT